MHGFHVHVSMCIKNEKKSKLNNHDCLPTSLLLYIMLYIMLAYLMLLAALCNAVVNAFVPFFRN